MTGLLLDHLWQSTLFAAAAGLLTLLLKANSASVRYGIWLAASLKFLIPLALLTAGGTALSDLLAAPLPAPAAMAVLDGASRPFSADMGRMAQTALAPASSWHLTTVLALVWFAGFAWIVGRWLRHWLDLRAIVRSAVLFEKDAPLRVKSSASLLEPGLIGILDPVLLLPAGIPGQLSASELDAVIAHELCHWRRRDNLTAALHMMVEALFWFHPLVWWLETRLIAERERACDEAVIAAGRDPEIYAESILKVCKHYVSPPLACAAGVSGADLKQRMEEIMKSKIIARLTMPKKALLAASAAAALVLPLAAGIFTAPPVFAQAGKAGEIQLAGKMAPAPRAQNSDSDLGRFAEMPSPGLANAVYLYATALQRGKPDYSLMTPRLQGSTREALEVMLRDARQLGPLQSVDFRGRNKSGWDVYEVRYQKGFAAFMATPLTGGKLDQLSWAATSLRN